MSTSTFNDDRLGFSIFVKNEILALPDLIEQVEPYFDEIVVLDTGSTDGTWEYLRNMEKKLSPKFRPYRIPIPFEAGYFHFGYVRSVAAHLNHCGYVLMLDADERMDEEGLAQIRNGLHPQARQNAWFSMSFPRYNWYGPPDERKEYDVPTYPDWQTRLIRNDGTVWWRRPVHEGVFFGPEGEDINHMGTKIHIHHFHPHFKGLKNDDKSFHRTYIELAGSDPEWIHSYPPRLLPNTDSNRENEIKALYLEVLGREADQDGLAVWAASEFTIEEIRKQFMDSDEYAEYKRKHED